MANSETAGGLPSVYPKLVGRPITPHGHSGFQVEQKDQAFRVLESVPLLDDTSIKITIVPDKGRIPGSGHKLDDILGRGTRFVELEGEN